jgi:hypothetical protein
VSPSIHIGAQSKGAFHLPLDIATGKVGILGRSGSGKTVTARVLAEGFITHHCQTVIIDPLDVWWGLRSHVDGGPGLNVVIAGGCKADLPLMEHGGEALADLVVERGINLLVVLSELSKNAARRFVAEFCERLYHRKNAQEFRTPTHLIIDEADAFVPQRLVPEATRCFGAVDTIIRRGRSRGLGSTLISQRPATIAKDVLSQIELLVAMQVTAPQDRKALKEWVDGNATVEEGRKVLDSLAGLPRGTAWVWAPGMDLLEQVRVRLPHTYDSSYTPKIGEKRPAAPTLKPIDLEQIRTQLAAVVEEAKANDPKALRAVILDLRRQIDTAKSPVPGFTKQELDDVARDVAARAVSERDAQWRKALGIRADELRTLDPGVAAFVLPAPVTTTARVGRAIDIPEPRRAKATQAGDPSMKPAQRRVLAVLAQHQSISTESLEKKSLAARTGYSANSGTFDTLLSGLRTAGWLAHGAFQITPEGIKALGAYDAPPSPGAALREWWFSKVTPAQKRVLSALEAGPLSKAALAEAAGYSTNSGTFDTMLSGLRTLGLLVGGGREEMRLHGDIA